VAGDEFVSRVVSIPFWTYRALIHVIWGSGSERSEDPRERSEQQRRAQIHPKTYGGVAGVRRAQRAAAGGKKRVEDEKMMIIIMFSEALKHFFEEQGPVPCNPGAACTI